MWQLLLYTLVLLLLLFGPANREFNQQWFIVPGGIVQRKAGWLQSRWKLHLFERRASALCVSHWWRKIWAVHVVDAQASARRMLTRTEAEFLLRAWLSPLPPPPLERLSDLG